MSATPHLFRWLLAANLFLALLASFVDVIFPSLIPQVLWDAQAKMSETDAESDSLAWWLAIGVVLLTLAAASYLGLYLFKPWGRRLAVLTTLLAIPLYFPIGPVIQSAVSTLLLESAMIIWGAILAMAYFSPLKTRFEAPAKNAIPPATGAGAADGGGLDDKQLP